MNGTSVKRRQISKNTGSRFTKRQPIFFDPHALTFYDPDHSDDEERFITLGMAATSKILFVAHTDRGMVTRIISAREATKKECDGYEKANR
jgi:hypothetical protein